MTSLWCHLRLTQNGLRADFFNMCRIVAGRGTANFKAKFPVLQQLFAKNHKVLKPHPLWPPPPQRCEGKKMRGTEISKCLAFVPAVLKHAGRWPSRPRRRRPWSHVNNVVCRIFQDGKAYPETCAKGLVFNPNIDNCDKASSYKCGKSIKPAGHIRHDLCFLNPRPSGTWRVTHPVGGGGGRRIDPTCDFPNKGPISKIQTPFNGPVREVSKHGEKYDLEVIDDVTAQVKVGMLHFSRLVRLANKILTYYIDAKYHFLCSGTIIQVKSPQVTRNTKRSQ